MVLKPLKEEYALNNNIKYRLKFSKLSRLRFIGHLDLLSLFQLSIKRAAIPIAYSNGFNPHQLMSFALPLSLGMASVGEYIDIELKEEADTNDIIQKLNEVVPEGLEIIEARKLIEGEKNAASIVQAGIYEITFPKDFLITDTIIQQMLDKSEINVTKKSKKKETEINIRPYIYKANLLEVVNSKKSIELLIATGSKENLKPELVISYLYNETGQAYNQYHPYYLRKDLLKLSSNRFISVMEVGDNL